MSIFVYNAIINTQITYPQTISQEKEFISLINGLLNKDKNKTLYGKEVRKNNWFRNVDWDGIEQMTVSAPTSFGLGDYDSALKASNYLSALKVQLASKKETTDKSKKEKIITDYDINKAKKWLEDF